MPIRAAKLFQTVSFRTSRGRTFNAVVTGLQPATPTLNVPTTQTSGGILGTAVATSYRLSVVINGAESQASTAQGVTTGAGTTNQVTITWPAVTGANSYRVYGRTAGTQLFIAEIAAGTTQYIDTGSVTPAGALPTAGEIGLAFYNKQNGTVKRDSIPRATAMRQSGVYYQR